MYGRYWEPYNPYDSLPPWHDNSRKWLGRVLKKVGGAETFDIHFHQAVERVEVNAVRKPTMAGYLDCIITDPRNIRNALRDLLDKPRSQHEEKAWEELNHHFFDKAERFSIQLRAGRYRKRRERVVEKIKANGGTRQIVVQAPIDRVIDRAFARILGPVLDSTFQRNSFAYRPGLGCWHSIKRARRLIKQGVRFWVSCDVRNAFGSVSLPRLLDIFKSRLPDDDLNEIVSKRLSGSPVQGLRQGSPLSALLLNLYLDHLLDRPWRRSHPDCPLIRYADDILIACRSKQEAIQCYRDLLEMLRPHGMKPKEPEGQAVIELEQEEVPYLGFLLSIEDGILTTRIAPRSYNNLRCNLLEEDVHCKKNDPQIKKDLTRCVLNWINYYGPAYAAEDRSSVYCTALRIMTELGKAAEMPRRKKFNSIWRTAYERYRQLRLNS